MESTLLIQLTKQKALGLCMSCEIAFDQGIEGSFASPKTKLSDNLWCAKDHGIAYGGKDKYPRSKTFFQEKPPIE